MARFGISDYPILLSWSLPILLVADTPITVISCVVASIAKTPQQVLTISGGSALATESMDRTTPSKVNKENTSSAEAPTTQALVARLRSKASDDAPVDNDPDLLNFVTAVFWIGCWMGFLPQKYWHDPGKPDGPIFVTPDVSLSISVCSHKDVECDFWMRL
jgi:hypothetical protein